MALFRILLAAAWLAIMWISVDAISVMGTGAAGDTFFADFAHPWRAQFNGDFAVHLFLMAAWVGYRERRLLIGIPCGLASIFLGGAFSFAYIFVATFRCHGDFVRLLVGDREPRPH